MSEKRFVIIVCEDDTSSLNIIDCQEEDAYNFVNDDVSMYEAKRLVALLNEQEEEISYWKHRVSSLLFILSQFDNEKVKKLLEELDE